MLSENERYLFPQEISKFMRDTYKHPAIYKWAIENDRKIESIYIGEAEKLCPRRIRGYLKPGPTQMTNIRLNSIFTDSLKNDKTVSLYYMMFSTFTINDKEISIDELKDKYIRRLLENLLIIEEKKQDVNILNN